MYVQTKTVGTGVLDGPPLAIMYLIENHKISLCLGRTVEDACPYNFGLCEHIKLPDKSQFNDEQM